MTSVPLIHRRFGETLRTDAWWLKPAAIFTLLMAFIVYANWAAFANANYWWGPYLSPFYSPEIWGASPHALLGPKPGWWPGWVPFSPALVILPFPLSFRLTCYYYRGSYYKAFWADPPNCSVGEPRNSYLGEKFLPLVLQNIHRYALYAALIFIVILSTDVWKALWWENPDGTKSFGMGVGTIVLALNVVFISCYTFGCHSLRHIVGGFLDRMSGRPVNRAAYACVSCFNRWHSKWAWTSLVWVGFSDLYVRMLATGVWTDYRFF